MKNELIKKHTKLNYNIYLKKKKNVNYSACVSTAVRYTLIVRKYMQENICYYSTVLTFKIRKI